jgi:hypothetical protein
MSESAASLYRCTCPHCQKVLKIRTEWAGKRGTCPQCRGTVEFPAFRAPSSNSATTQQLLKLVRADDDPTFDESQAERLSLLLSQGTCIDYGMADTLLASRPLSPRQWRRVLNAADLREAMRLRFDARIDEETDVTESADEPVALLAAADAATPNAWKILSRFLYYQRHRACEACEANPTGLTCIYRSFDAFQEARLIPEARAENWKALLHRHLGL